eukprot:gene8637-17813_t
MSNSQPHLKIRKDPNFPSCTLWTCPTPQNLRTGNPMIWFKKQGKSFNYIEFIVDLIGVDEIIKGSMYLAITLLYASHIPVANQKILDLLHDGIIQVDDSNTRMIRVDSCSRQVTIRFRIDEVSSRHQGQLFCIRIAANGTSGLPITDIIPDISSSIEVRSRLPEERTQSSSGSTTNFGPVSPIHDGQQPDLPPGSPSPSDENRQILASAISNTINWHNFLMETVERLLLIGDQRVVNQEDLTFMMTHLSSGYNNHYVQPSLMILQQEIINQSQSSSSTTSTTATATTAIILPLPSIPSSNSIQQHHNSVASFSSSNVHNSDIITSFNVSTNDMQQQQSLSSTSASASASVFIQTHNNNINHNHSQGHNHAIQYSQQDTSTSMSSTSSSTTMDMNFHHINFNNENSSQHSNDPQQSSVTPPSTLNGHFPLPRISSHSNDEFTIGDHSTDHHSNINHTTSSTSHHHVDGLDEWAENTPDLDEFLVRNIDNNNNIRT